MQAKAKVMGFGVQCLVYSESWGLFGFLGGVTEGVFRQPLRLLCLFPAHANQQVVLYLLYYSM